MTVVHAAKYIAACVPFAGDQEKCPFQRLIAALMIVGN
jgi:hypothetical protein